MIVIVCLDENNGMMFHGKRQSRDKALTERIRQISKGKRIWMNNYSYQLYGDLESTETVADKDFLAKAGTGEICLVETERLVPVLDRIEGVFVFRWNRKYPADFRLDLKFAEWERMETRKFPGVSHEKITEEFYKKKKEAVS